MNALTPDLTAHLRANETAERVRVLQWLGVVIDRPPPDRLDDNAIRATANELAHAIRYRCKPSAGSVEWLRRMASHGAGQHREWARVALGLIGGSDVSSIRF